MERAENLGYDSLWTPDHLLPTSGHQAGPILEAYMALAAVAANTSRATLGLLVSPITIRNPALVTKMITTLDHISGGRAILGIGAGWAEEEHRQFGIEFGDGFDGYARRCRSCAACLTALVQRLLAITTPPLML